MTYLVSDFQLNKPDEVVKFMSRYNDGLTALAFTRVPYPSSEITVIGVHAQFVNQFFIVQVVRKGDEKYDMTLSVYDCNTGSFVKQEPSASDTTLVANLLSLPQTDKLTTKRLKMLHNGELNPVNNGLSAFIPHRGSDESLNQYKCRVSYTKQLPPQLVTEVKDCNTMTAADYTTYVNSLLSNRDYSFSVENRIVTLNRRVTETEECVMDFAVTGYTEEDALDTLEHVKTFVRSKLTSITMSVYLPDNVISSNGSGGMSDLEWFIKDYATKHEGVGKSRMTYSISQSSYVEV